MNKFQKRIIARLDIKGSRLIKGIRFEGLRVLGNPCDAANDYYSQGIDEIFYSDAVASLYSRNGLDKILKDTCRSIFVPVTAGGAIKSIEDAYMLLKAGADKVAINTQAVKNPSLLTKLANRFGEQCVVLSIQTRRSQKINSGWEVMIEAGRERTGIDLQLWIENAQKLGIGEIFLTSVDQDGTNKGPDIELIRMVDNLVYKPLVIGGGFNLVSNVETALEFQSVSGVCIGSALHYKKLKVIDIKNQVYSNKINLRNNYTEKISWIKDKNKKVKIGIIDYGMGNQQSLINALHYLGHEVFLTHNREEIKNSELIILPGVGSFPEGMKELQDRGLKKILIERSINKKPIVGICLGMQLLFENSCEFSLNKGLGIFKGEIKNIKELEIKDKNYSSEFIKLPHMGWNSLVEYVGNSKFEEYKEFIDQSYYFVHNFAAESITNSDFFMKTTYQGRELIAICGLENNFGFQFHPERSGIAGLNLLSKVINNFYLH